LSAPKKVLAAKAARKSVDSKLGVKKPHRFRLSIFEFVIFETNLLASSIGPEPSLSRRFGNIRRTPTF